LRRMTSWTRQKMRHALSLFRQGRNPAATVYDSIGSDFFLAIAPGWLNLGLWEGPGSEEEAPRAVRRLVERLAEELPRGGTVLDVGNGLGVQDPVIAKVAEPRRLVTMNITESQLRAGTEHVVAAGGCPVVGDAVRIPLADGSVDGVISVEAAFHFASRRRFFAEAYRVLRPGGVLSMSDVPVLREARGILEHIAGLFQLRVWGLNAQSVATEEEIAAACRTAGFTEIRTELVGERVIDPALQLTRARLVRRDGASPSIRLAARAVLSQAELLRNRGVVDYLLLRATKP
ncbi:MAG TPA: methyltransferase domain-containing protein, partial [Actinomycetota bacterium]|nr:methyltransferase domain-containing protein [Actinomycetota bacterium]